ncbi:casein kinase II subunit alpha'-interacting protein isoform X2 [Homo sapiens]|uniref:casein kinase II subunit alpha'-interacting protein isoform X2 n=1 Tax=Homo sapiens TaxID=9606 RepID=UPI0005D00C16|nr:casein kinase II subunit alpha'-interacting protein isoform X2 [Homo sapiens]XP_054201053.1 casein kinase II subunit alpha'-interacting protein isoform X2 [Homo sapiens]
MRRTFQQLECGENNYRNWKIIKNSNLKALENNQRKTKTSEEFITERLLQRQASLAASFSIKKIFLDKNKPIAGWKQGIGPSVKDLNKKDAEDINHRLINAPRRSVPLIEATLAFGSSYPRSMISILFLNKVKI